ncbi:Phage head morphogenesis domain containing protein [uncultured Caudovirales phage]|uniref:Phage head morphogenesis domain containing protein n=1 Tax=uncultured Caudovirales phage TaxID=2100421 RepID=A0A6J7WUH5_9CAUD|nr:Phage head morphogenesis domain containing protein [uncultured Caudovirales phage]
MPKPTRRLLPAGPFQRLRPRLIPPEAIVTKAGKDDLLTEIERLAKKIEPVLADAIMSYLQGMKDSIDLQALADALASGDVGKVIGLLAGADLNAAKAQVADSIQAAVWGGGAIAALGINQGVSGIHFAFDKLNPRLVTWLQTYSLNLIRQINDDTKEAIRDKLISGMTSGASPIAVAREVKGAIGLTTRQAQAVKNYRKELETFHLKTSAGGYGLGNKIDRVNGRQVFKPDDDGTPMDGIDVRRLRDFRYDGQLANAIKTGKPLKPEQIDKMVAAYERKYLRHRSETIARTEALRTTNFGVQDAWRQAIEGGKANESLVRRQWIVAKDERLCEVCAPVPGLNPKRGVKFDQPFATPKGPVMLPPVHPNCRCTVFLRQWEPEQLA